MLQSRLRWLGTISIPARHMLVTRRVSSSFRHFHPTDLRATVSNCAPYQFHNEGARERLADLQSTGVHAYPRLSSAHNRVTCKSFNERFGALDLESSGSSPDAFALHGRIVAIRRAGSKLVFVDIIQNGHRVQALCNFRKIFGPDASVDEFRKCFQKLRRGDHIRIEGVPSRSNSGELTLSLTKLPELLCPCLPDLPTRLDDPETRMRLRHLDFLVNTRGLKLMRLKSEVIKYLRSFLLADDYLEVQTPTLAERSGGAIARPFETRATEFPGRPLSLRIAPELWLKRLVVGGLDRIFEIGPSFRNEGVDSTHNPEFTSCEFYRSFANLEDLVRITEQLFEGLANHLTKKANQDTSFIQPMPLDFAGPYRRIDFIPHIEAALGRKLPDLGGPGALESLTDILKTADINIPAFASLPQALDRLSSILIEPNCIAPTFIVHHPECLSPLSKSFRHPQCGQQVAARAELFVDGREIVNTYEEENSPLEQRRKFEDQKRFKEHFADTLDESYLEALEWGLPPTGGWGGGIERICMLFADTNRIGDILSFGTLRNVVALGHGGVPRL